ncbi:dihydrofolate reductase family protein, partial [Streptomyces sp. NPDC005921]
MGKLVSTMFVTLDGVYQAPGGPEEDPSGGFTHGGWSFHYGDEDFGRFVTEVFDRAGAFLLGRRTYDIFAAYWPKETDPADLIAAKLNALPKYVPSATLTDPGWSGTTVLGGDLAKEVTALRERTDGELQVHGSGALVRSLLDLGLLDVLHLVTFPPADPVEQSLHGGNHPEG